MEGKMSLIGLDLKNYIYLIYLNLVKDEKYTLEEFRCKIKKIKFI